MRILFIGDIFAKPGRKAVIENVKRIVDSQNINYVIANAENATHGRSLSQTNYDELIDAGVNLITMGNHTWDTTSVFSVLDNNDKIIRPYNIKATSKESAYGKGYKICLIGGKKVLVTNLLSTQCSSRAEASNPFLAMDEILNKVKADIYIVDFHAETTSEKNAFLMNFAGRVSLIVCTHTHVQTADEKIYKDTAYITDLGMCGAKESIIGAKPDEIIAMFRGELPRFHLEPAKGEYQFNSVIVEFDDKTNKPISITRYNINQN